eukprot:TRINITY_DN11344_c0_g1_i1.p2 TRINITY_DN11344_c0_g1~~TRINITY_DN11344_c0_g1_i1.p2  ORF type:complete len:206 (-),score=35.09 TRINITY_DN11344_c0_g1_i1:73-690(-)
MAATAALRQAAALPQSLSVRLAGGNPYRGVRFIQKFTRWGFWARGGKDGRHTMTDPRIFRPEMERKYPYHKMRRWSKPYMCLQHNAPAPLGAAVKLEIAYEPWTGSEAYMQLRRSLETALPGAQIVGNTDDAARGSTDDALRRKGDDKPQRRRLALRVTRVSDGRGLLELTKGEEPQAFEAQVVEKLVHEALDNFDWRYGPPPSA